MRAKATLPAFGKREELFGRQGARIDPTARRRRAPAVRVSTPLQSHADHATSILVASVDAIRRTLGDSITVDAVELACAKTYQRTADRERYLAARMLLRHALTQKVGGRVSPMDWKYVEGPYGKPMMAAGLPALEFSISHSGGYVAVGVSTKAPIGIDIECIDTDERMGVIYDVLTEVERHRLVKSPADQQWARFIRIWTAKEACSKALGLGLSLDFQRMEVQFDPIRVRLLDRPISATNFEVAATTVARDGRSYSLSVARIVDNGL
jgi:phosphopantetheine--protein transferase-like protein